MLCKCGSGNIHARNMCSKCYNKWYYENNREYHHNKNVEWALNNKEYNNKRNREWIKNNKDKIRVRTKERYWNNKEEERGKERTWRKTPNGKMRRKINESKRRARKRANCNKEDDINIENAITNFDRCVYCGSLNNLTIEHIIPIYSGGNNSIDNIVIACSSCNSSKQNKNLLLWISINKINVYNKIVIDKYYRMVNNENNQSR